MKAKDHLNQGRLYYQHAKDAPDEMDRAYWMDKLDTAVDVSRAKFGSDVRITKELESLLEDLLNHA